MKVIHILMKVIHIVIKIIHTYIKVFHRYMSVKHQAKNTMTNTAIYNDAVKSYKRRNTLFQLFL